MAMFKGLKTCNIITNVLKCTQRPIFNRLYSAKYAQTLLNIPEIKITELNNGLKIATDESDSPTATVGLWIDAGSRYELDNKNGVAHFFEHLAFNGTLRRPQNVLEQMVQDIGAIFESYTDREETAFYAKCLSKDVPIIVEILGSIIQNTTFNEEQVESTRNVILNELDEAENDFRQVTFAHLHETAYQGTPLSKSVLGSSENIKSINGNDVAVYARNAFVAPRIALVTSGNVKHEDVVKAAEKTMNTVPMLYTDEIPVLDQCRFTGSEIRVRNDWFPACYGAIAVDTCGFDNPDIYPLMLAQTIIGNWHKNFQSSKDTVNSLVRKICKDEGCYSFESFYKQYKHNGLWGCYFVIDGLLVDDFIFNLQNEWMRICTNPTECSLTIAKNMLKSNLLLHFDNPVNLCTDIAKQVLHFNEHTPFDEVDDQIEAVTLAQLNDVASKYIYDKCPAIAAIGQIEAFTEYTRVRGNMYWLRY